MVTRRIPGGDVVNRISPPIKVLLNLFDRKVFFLFSLLIYSYGLLPLLAAGQMTPGNEVESVLEALQDGERDLTSWAEWLDEYRLAPLNLNRAGLSEMMAFPLFTDLTARALYDYRETHGGFRTVNDLIQVEGLSPALVDMIKPFVTLASAQPVPEGSNRHRLEILTRSTRTFPSGSGDNQYPGSPYRLYHRFRYSGWNGVSAGVTMEKDPGEPVRWSPESHQFGYDFVSLHGAWTGTGRIRKILMGDYSAGAGSGLALARNLSFGKTPVSSGIDPAKGGVFPYRSSDETNYFRGLAVQLQPVDGIQVTLMGSSRNLDASYDTLSQCVVSLPASGYHRTAGEQERRALLSERLIGAIMAYTGKTIQGGITTYASSYTPSLAPSIAGPDVFRNIGHATLVSSYLVYQRARNQIFAEAGRDYRGTWAGHAGLFLAPARPLSLSIHVRRLPASFFSPHGSIRTERSGAPVDENGLYVSIRLQPVSTLFLDAYQDFYEFPGLGNKDPFPVHGTESYLKVTFVPKNWLQLYLLGRTETKESNAETAEGLYVLKAKTRQSVRFHGVYEHSDRLQFHARLEIVRSFSAGSRAAMGMLMFQRIRWIPSSNLRIDVQHGTFDAEEYDSRLYQIESDLTYTFAMFSFNGRGSRSYVLATLRPWDGLSIQAKYALTRLAPDRETRPLPGSVRWELDREVRLQVNLSL